MTGHRCVIEAGPGTIRRLCCGGTGQSAKPSLAAVALDCLDDPVALIDGQPVDVAELWRAVLRSLSCPARAEPKSVQIIHPSWWSTARVQLVVGAAKALADDVGARPRSKLLAGAAADSTGRVIVEVAARLVAITAAGTVAEPRVGTPDDVAGAVLRRIVASTHGTAVVLIDAPDGVHGAAALATMIAERLRDSAVHYRVELLDDTGVAALGAAERPAVTAPPQPEPVPAADPAPRRKPVLLAAAVALTAGSALLGTGVPAGHDGAAPAPEELPATFLVEGRVALQVPEHWPVRRITAGPGSARVEITSPSDPQVILHMTQSPVAGGTLASAAEAMNVAVQQANAAEKTEVFVDFDPSGQSAGRPAITYRELRGAHHVDWVVLVDTAVRISIGCQHRPGDADAVRAVCEQAVRSARALS